MPISIMIISILWIRYHYDQQVEIEVDPRLKSFLTYCYKLGNNTSASPSPLPTTQSTSKSIGRKTAPTNFVYQGSGFDDSDDCDSDRDLVAELGDRSDSDSNISCSRSSNSSNSICRSNSNDNSNENSSSGGSHCAGSGIRVDDMTTALCGRDPNYKMEFSSSIFQAVREMSPFFDYGDPNMYVGQFFPSLDTLIYGLFSSLVYIRVHSTPKPKQSWSFPASQLNTLLHTACWITRRHKKCGCKITSKIERSLSPRRQRWVHWRTGTRTRTRTRIEGLPANRPEDPQTGGGGDPSPIHPVSSIRTAATRCDPRSTPICRWPTRDAGLCEAVA